MNSNKSFGYDGISAKILKKIAKESSKPLTHIFNLSFLNGIIPDKLKFALVTPMHKGNEESKVDNYRPISVLNYFSKLLEQFVDGRLKHLLIRTIFYQNINMVLGKIDPQNCNT